MGRHSQWKILRILILSVIAKSYIREEKRFNTIAEKYKLVASDDDTSYALQCGRVPPPLYIGVCAPVQGNSGGSN